MNSQRSFADGWPTFALLVRCLEADAPATRLRRGRTRAFGDAGWATPVDATRTDLPGGIRPVLRRG